MDRSFISKAFLIFLIISVIYIVFRIFQPFLAVILAAAILVSIFYTPFLQLVKLFRGRRNLAAFVMCVIIALLVIVPLANFIAYTAQRSIVAYDSTVKYFEDRDLGNIIKTGVFDRFNVLDLSSETVQNTLIETAKKVNDWLVSGAGTVIKGTTNFIISVFLIFLTMFFFFVEGEKMLEKLSYLTKLPNKYDRDRFKNNCENLLLETSCKILSDSVGR